MSYPSVYCVRCKAHTDTLGRHTVILSNKRRALKGVCPVCASETYRMMPQKKEERRAETDKKLLKVPTQLSLISAQKPLRPEVFSEIAPVYRKKLDPVSEAVFIKASLAERLMTYGLLTTVFGLAAILGFMICVVLFKR